MKSWPPTPTTRRLSGQGFARAAAGAWLRDPDVHGRPPRPGQVRRLERGRCARHPQRRRAGERRRDPFPRDLLQAARHPRVVRDPPHQLRHGVLHRRRDAWAAGQQPRDGGARRRWLHRRRRRTRLQRGQLHRLAHDQRQRTERHRRRDPHPCPPAGARTRSRSTATSTTSRPDASSRSPTPRRPAQPT